MSGSQIILTDKDFSKLKEIKCFHSDNEYKKLEEEIEHAKVVPEFEISKDVVTMNNQITLLILGKNEKINVTIVYPCDADFFQHKISVLSTLGMSLLGLKVNDVIDWSSPTGETKKLKILGVQSQSAIKNVVH